MLSAVFFYPKWGVLTHLTNSAEGTDNNFSSYVAHAGPINMHIRLPNYFPTWAQLFKASLA